MLRKFIFEDLQYEGEKIEFIKGLYPTYQKIRDYLENSDPEEIYHSWEKVKDILDNAIGVIYLHKDEYSTPELIETWEGTLRDFQSLKRKHAEKAIKARNHLLGQDNEL